MKKIINKKILLIIGILFIIGIISGVLFFIFTSDLDKFIVKQELEEYISLIKGDNSYFEALFRSFKTNLSYLTIIACSSILFVFSPLILFVNFYKGFLVGFMISSFILSYKVKGVFYSLLFMFPHEFINIIILSISSIIVLNYTYKIIKSIYENENINLRLLIKKYVLMYLIFAGGLLISSMLEVFLNGFLLRFVL